MFWFSLIDRILNRKVIKPKNKVKIYHRHWIYSLSILTKLGMYHWYIDKKKKVCSFKVLMIDPAVLYPSESKF